jgi:hypothetical protein
MFGSLQGENKKACSTLDEALNRLDRRYGIASGLAVGKK